MSFITTTFEISDYTNGIVLETIGLTPKSVGTIITSAIQSLQDIRKYSVPVLVSATGYVEISATNFVNQTTTFKENNFIVACSENKKTNLVRFLPQYLRDDFNGNPSEFYQFTKVFEDYLNTMYYDINEGCNLSILEKTKRLKNLRNIDKIDSQYIYHYANMLGYDVGINQAELGTFFPTSGNYSDSFQSYQDKCLRFVVGNLPNWYSIKTTRNAVKMMLLSFGIIGDVIEEYTSDYDKYWLQNRTVNGQYVSDNIPGNYFSTPHITVGIDLKNTPNSTVYSNNMGKVKTAMESIRPANVVINGLQGIVSSIQLPTFNLVTSFRVEKSITVTRTQQINI